MAESKVVSLSIHRRSRDARDFSEAAVRASVSEVLSGTTIWVSPDAPAKDAFCILEGSDLTVVAVVDAGHRLLGTVSKATRSSLPTRKRVSDVMQVPEHVLSESSPIAHAIALMAFEAVEVVPVVTEKNELVGMLHARDLLRWTAEQMGYDASSAALPTVAATGNAP